MPSNITEYRCLLISPGDVDEERDALTDLITKWNASVGQGLNCRIELIRWETHAVPDASNPPQGAINEQLLDDCDMAVAVFWSRLGSPTTEFLSGSLEEIETLLGKGVRVLIYFSERAIPQENLKDNQYQKLQDWRREMQEKGLIQTFSDTSNLREQVNLHLTQLITTNLAKDAEVSDLSGTTATNTTAPAPDVRLKTTFVIGGRAGGPTEEFVCVTVENHSTQPVFTGNIGVTHSDGHYFLPLSDAVTGQSQYRRRLEPGESFDFYMAPAELLKWGKPDEFVGVIMKDSIGRTYEVDADEVKNNLVFALKKRAGE